MKTVLKSIAEVKLCKQRDGKNDCVLYYVKIIRFSVFRYLCLALIWGDFKTIRFLPEGRFTYLSNKTCKNAILIPLIVTSQNVLCYC